MSQDRLRAEIERFASVLTDSLDRFPNLDLEKTLGLFRQLGQALLSDPEEGRRRVLDEVAIVRDDDQQRDLVRSAALIAIEADGRTLESEEAVSTIGRAMKSLVLCASSPMANSASIISCAAGRSPIRSRVPGRASCCLI